MSEELIIFNKDNVIDTCSIWNLLYSTKLYGISLEYFNSIVITDYVRYEALLKVWNGMKKKAFESELKKRLAKELKNNNIIVYNISVEELQDPQVLKDRKKFGKGEISCIVFAKNKNISFITDDQGARKYSKTILGNNRVRTIPHLVGFLFFISLISDSDISEIIIDHKRFKSDIVEYIKTCYETSMKLKINSRN